MRLSDPLKHDAIAAGYIQPWARDNAKRKPDRKGYRLRSRESNTSLRRLVARAEIGVSTDGVGILPLAQANQGSRFSLRQV